MTPTQFNATLNLFFQTATDVLIGHAAWIDKFVGDEIIAFFLPNAVQNKHDSTVALEAARELLHSTAQNHLPIGIGVHTGRAYMGTVGGSSVSDVTAVGDDVNVTARRASAAAPRTIVASEAACLASNLKLDDTPRKELELKGKNQPVPVRILA